MGPVVSIFGYLDRLYDHLVQPSKIATSRRLSLLKIPLRIVINIWLSHVLDVGSEVPILLLLRNTIFDSSTRVVVSIILASIGGVHVSRLHCAVHGSFVGLNLVNFFRVLLQ